MHHFLGFVLNFVVAPHKILVKRLIFDIENAIYGLPVEMVEEIRKQYLKNLNRSANIITTNIEYTIDPQSKIEDTTRYYDQTLEVVQHHAMDPIMEGILSCSLASSRGHPPIEVPLQIQYYLHIPLHCFNPFI
jgi:hypothetical protein